MECRIEQEYFFLDTFFFEYREKDDICCLLSQFVSHEFHCNLHPVTNQPSTLSNDTDQDTSKYIA